jgi:hypothetical protein
LWYYSRHYLRQFRQQSFPPKNGTVFFSFPSFPGD